MISNYPWFYMNWSFRNGEGSLYGARKETDFNFDPNHWMLDGIHPPVQRKGEAAIHYTESMRRSAECALLGYPDEAALHRDTADWFKRIFGLSEADYEQHNL